MDGERYRHTQWGKTIIVAAVGVLATGTTLALVGGAPMAVYVTLPVGLLMCALFGALTITVTDSHVYARFGIGLISKQVALSDIRSATVVKNPWWVGAGIRIIDGGWLYSVDGRRAVDLRLANGSRIALGSDEPAALQSAIADAAGIETGATVEDEGGRGVFALIATIAILVCVGVMLYLQTQPAHVNITRESVTITNVFYKTVIPTKQITEVVVADSAPVLEARTNGFALGSARRGRFRVQGLGSGMLYLEMDSAPYVVIKWDSTSFAILSYKDYDYTSKLIEGLAKVSAR